MAKKKYKKVPISDELRDTARRFNDLLDDIAGDDVLEITAENLERFQAAFQKAGVTDDDVDRLQWLLMRFERDITEKEFKLDIEHWGIALRVRELINKWGMNVDAAYEDVADEVGLDKSSVGKIYRKFSRS